MIAFTETFVRTLLRGADEQGSCLFGAHYSCGAEKPSPNFLNSLGVQPIQNVPFALLWSCNAVQFP